MDTKRFEEILSLGETICTEFKRCGNGIESDVYETVCSFIMILFKYWYANH